jgi:hypothetical protein
MENRPVNSTIKSTIPRTNVTEPQTDKKTTKPTTTTNKSTTQKPTNSNKPTVNAPVKPMPNKKTLSPMDDRLSDEECKFTYFNFFLFFNKIFFLKLHRNQIQYLYQQMYHLDVHHIQHLVRKIDYFLKEFRLFFFRTRSST